VAGKHSYQQEAGAKQDCAVRLRGEEAAYCAARECGVMNVDVSLAGFDPTIRAVSAFAAVPPPKLFRKPAV
jgi:hypothetical protein